MSTFDRSTRARRGFTVIEFIVAMTLVALMAGTAAIRMGTYTARVKQAAEADRMVQCLRWLRQCAISRGPHWAEGYGMYFWSNRRSGTCIQYNPYTPVNWRVADDPQNTINELHNAGSPRFPLNIGIAQPGEYRSDFADTPDMSPETLTAGLEIVFQTDVPNQPDLKPISLPKYPSITAGYDQDRIVFWPPGTPARGPLIGAPWPVEMGVTLPRVRRGSNWVYYNRIYIRSITDTPGVNWDPDSKKLPARIHIHPATGAIRLMDKYEL